MNHLLWHAVCSLLWHAVCSLLHVSKWVHFAEHVREGAWWSQELIGRVGQVGVSLSATQHSETQRSETQCSERDTEHTE